MASHNQNKLEPPAQRASRLQLEHRAIDETFCDYAPRREPYGASQGEIEHSAAISLKRIADRLEAITTIYSVGGGELDHGQINVGCEGNINVSNSY